MKKYRICLFLFLGVSLVCVLIAFFVRRNWENSGAVDTPETAIERDTVPETVTEDQMAANNDHVQAVAESREIYYGCGGWYTSRVFKGPENHLSVYPCAVDGFSA